MNNKVKENTIGIQAIFVFLNRKTDFKATRFNLVVLDLLLKIGVAKELVFIRED